MWVQCCSWKFQSIGFFLSTSFIYREHGRFELEWNATGLVEPEDPTIGSGLGLGEQYMDSQQVKLTGHIHLGLIPPSMGSLQSRN